MKRLFLMLLLFVPVVQLFSQYTPAELINEVKTLATRRAADPLSYKEVEGTAYYTPDFIKSTVFLKNGTYASLPLRYDLFQDEMEYKDDSRILWIVKSDIKYIRYGSDMLFVAPSVLDTSRLGYYFFKDAGKNKLFCRKSMKFCPWIPPKGYADMIPNRFEPNSDEFYIQFEGQPAKRIKTKGELTKLFSNNKSALEFIKKEKIKANNFDDLQKLMNYINSQ